MIRRVGLGQQAQAAGADPFQCRMPMAFTSVARGCGEGAAREFQERISARPGVRFEVAQSAGLVELQTAEDITPENCCSSDRPCAADRRGLNKAGPELSVIRPGHIDHYA